jgi:hypothetical protein
VVEEVEELARETKPHPLGEAKLPLKRNISLSGSKTAKHIAPEISLLPGGRWSKRRFIERLASRILRSIDAQAALPALRPGAGTARCRPQTRCRQSHSLAEPISRKSSRPPTNSQGGAGDMVPFGSGQIVCHTCGEGVTDLEVGVATVDLWIGDETRRVQVCGERISLSNVDRVRPRTRRACLVVT